MPFQYQKIIDFSILGFSQISIFEASLGLGYAINQKIDLLIQNTDLEALFLVVGYRCNFFFKVPLKIIISEINKNHQLCIPIHIGKYLKMIKKILFTKLCKKVKNGDFFERI